jgi:glycosyltransferase involved in cell wall biosynthesis
MPLFSIVVPVYNVERYIQVCLDSIQTQTYRDFEVIVVNDCTPDNSMELIKEYANKDNRFRIVEHTVNKGLVAARDTGVTTASGQYIIFVDSDDWIEQNQLEELSDCISKYDEPDVLLFGLYLSHNGKSSKVPLQVHAGLYKNDKLHELQTQMLQFSALNHQRIVAPNVYTKVYKREVINVFSHKIPLDITIGEDVPRSYPCLLKAKSLFVLDKHLYHYRMNQGSMSMKYSPKYLQHTLWIYPFILEQANQMGTVDISRAIAENIAHSAACAVCNEMISTKPRKQIKEFIRKEICENPLIQQSFSQAKGFHDYAYYRLIAYALHHGKVSIAYALGIPYRWFFKIQYAKLKKN